MFRFRSNTIVTDACPKLLLDVISVMPAIRPNCRSSGVATADAIVSALAPGNPAETEIVGESTCGNGDTGNKKYATPPANKIPIVSSVVPTGR